MKMPQLILLAILLLLSHFGWTQGRFELKDLAETLAREKNQASETLFEKLLELRDHPVDLNQTTQEELQATRLFDPFQIINLLEYRREVDQFLSIYELQAIKGFSGQEVQRILPFVTIDEHQPPSSPFQLFYPDRGRNDLLLRYGQTLEQQKGYSNGAYLGNPVGLYGRLLRKTYNGSSLGLTMEKDAGEEFFKDTQPGGFDFYSGHLLLKDLGPFETLVLGDFESRFGQGLTSWSGLSFSSSANPGSIKRQSDHFDAYTSSRETGFLRGIGTSLALIPQTQVSLFYSYQKVDARLEKEEKQNLPFITSLPGSGYHRTKTEISKKRTLPEQKLGGALTYRNNRFKTGLSFTSTSFQGELPPSSSLKNHYQPRGNTFPVGGWNFDLVLDHFNLFGELAVDKCLRPAYTLGVFGKPHDRLSFSLRNHFSKKGFQAPPTGSQVRPNESGSYFGFRALILPGIHFITFMEQEQDRWLGYRTDTPSRSRSLGGELDWKLTRNINLNLRYRRKIKERNSKKETRSVLPLIPHQTDGFRLNLKSQLTSSWGFNTRIHWTRFNNREQTPDNGMLLYQDLLWNPEQLPVSLRFRLAVFDTDSYDARIYAYEHDVLYAFSVPAYHGQGLRSYLTLKYEVSPNLHFWIRASRWSYINQETIGSGYQEIEGANKTSIRVQARVKF